MRSHAFVFLCLVIGARAASINPPEEKKIDALVAVELDAIKEPETIEQIAVSEVENDLRNAEIPVSVVEQQQLKKIDEISNDYVPDINDSGFQRRVELDLKNPGPPQRQEHETQNPGHYSDKVRALDNIKQKLEETQQVFKEQLKSLSTNFETLIQKSENLPIIQQKIQNFKSSFNDKVAELNNTIQSYIKPSSEDLKSDLKPVDVSNKEIENIESNLRKVQINFDSGISKLSEGVQLLALRKDEDESLAIKGKDESGAYPAAPSFPSIGPVAADIMSTLSSSQTSITTIFSNMFSQIQNWFKPSSSSSGTVTPTVLADVLQTQPQLPQQLPQPFRPIQGLLRNVADTLSSSPGQQANQVAQVPQAAQAVANLVPAQPSNSVPVAAENSQPQSAEDVQNEPRKKAEEPKEDRKSGYGGNYNNKGDNNDCNGIKEEAPQVENLEKDAGTQEVKEEKEIIEEPSSDATKIQD